MWSKLKKRWNITSNGQLIIIMIVFSITGYTTVALRKHIFHWMGYNSGTSYWILVPSYILTVPPVYQVLLLFYGTLFGQFKFFWNFEKKMVRRFYKR